MYLEHMLFSSAITRFYIARALPSAILLCFLFVCFVLILFFSFSKDYPVFQTEEKFLKMAFCLFVCLIWSPHMTRWILVSVRSVYSVCACFWWCNNQSQKRIWYYDIMPWVFQFHWLGFLYLNLNYFIFLVFKTEILFCVLG